MIAQDALLSAMRQVEAFSAALQSVSWIWGGLSMDVYQGRFLREHDDLDCLTLRLHELVDPLSKMFQEAGWQTSRLKNGDLKIEKGDIDIQLGHIDIAREVRWTHNGENGSLFFPVEWLVHPPRRFYDVDVHVVAPEFQYVLLNNPKLLNPSWEPRPKDLEAKTCLKSMLEAGGIDLEALQIMVHE